MKAYSLYIAGYKIGIVSDNDDIDLVPADRFLNSLIEAGNPDIVINVHRGLLKMPADAVRVFYAPLVEENSGLRLKKSDEFWSIYEDSSWIYVTAGFPYSERNKKGTLRFSLGSREWDLWLDCNGDAADPLEYPLDSLILYYLTVMSSDLMIHASGVNHNGQGIVFSGVSGSGKTTMARLWNNAGAVVIHDDRLIIRKTGEGYTMYNTPVYSNEVQSESHISRLFLIHHGKENLIESVSGAAAVSLTLSNCIQHNWNQKIIGTTVGSVTKFTSLIPVSRLHFVPDSKVVGFINDFLRQ